MGFFATAILSIIGLSISVLRTDSKALETSAGTLIADQVAQRLIAQLKADSPGGTRANFMDNEFVVNPWDKGSLKNENTEFFYTVHASTVTDATTGDPLGASLNGNRLKKADIHVWWASQNEQDRQGSGRLEVRMSKLISEADLVDISP